MRAKLPLEDVLDDTPQHRQLVSLCEEESAHLLSWGRRLLSAVTEWSFAQKRVGEAASHLSVVLAEYVKQGFVLDDCEVDMPRVTQKLARTVEETAGWMEVVGQQLENCVRYPISKICSELDDLLSEGRGEHLAAHDRLLEYEERFLKCGKKEGVNKLEDVNQNVYLSRVNYHKVALAYCARLNAVQNSRYTGLLEPMLSLVYACKSFFNAGHEAMRQPDVADFLSNTQQHIQRVAKESDEERGRTIEMLQGFEVVQQTEADEYMGEPKGGQEAEADGTHRQGYLRLKTKSGLFGSNWERAFVFLQGSAVMWQKEAEIAGSTLLELSAVSVRASECADSDRRFVFVLREADGHRRQWTMQARNTRDMKAWIAVLNNVAGNFGEKHSPSPQSGPPKGAEGGTAEADAVPRGESAVRPVGRTPGQSEPVPQPIQFDLLSIGRLPQGFDSTETNAATQFDVDYLGSLEVDYSGGDETVEAAIDAVLSSRATYGIEDKQHLCLLLCGTRLVLKDSEECLRAYFDFADIAIWMVSKNDARIFAMITRSDADVSARFSCAVFRSSALSASEVCAALAKATAHAFSKIQETAKDVVVDDPPEREQYESLSDKAKLDRELSG